MPARVLVVDDVPANVKILEAKLTAEYFEVLTAPHGRAALEIAEADMPLRGGAATVPQRVTVSIGVAALLPGEGATSCCVAPTRRSMPPRMPDATRSSSRRGSKPRFKNPR